MEQIIDPIAETIRTLESRIAHHRKRLEANRDFQAIQTLERSVKELRGGSTVGVVPVTITHATAAISQPAAARQAILAKGEPVQTAELLNSVLASGVKVGGGEHQLRNLSSMLSSNKGFKSVPWKSGSGWWVTDRELPKEDRLIP